MHNSLELYVHPLGKIPHAAVYTTNNRAGLPLGLLVHFGGAVELWHSTAFPKAALEVGPFLFWKILLILLARTSSLKL